jgi:hypothetical protein
MLKQLLVADQRGEKVLKILHPEKWSVWPSNQNIDEEKSTFEIYKPEYLSVEMHHLKDFKRDHNFKKSLKY